MKMNSLDAMFGVLRRVENESRVHLALFEPKKYAERIGRKTAAELGGVPILHMRAFQKAGRLPDDLVNDVVTRHSGN